MEFFFEKRLMLQTAIGEGGRELKAENVSPMEEPTQDQIGGGGGGGWGVLGGGGLGGEGEGGGGGGGGDPQNSFSEGAQNKFLI